MTNAEYIKEWRLKNKDRNRELRKKYKKSQKGIIANNEYQKRKNKKHPELYIKYRNKYLLNEENRRKSLMRIRDCNGIKNKLLEQNGFCQLCGSIKNLELHHKTYDETRNVILLCRSCHRKLHFKLKTGGKKDE